MNTPHKHKKSIKFNTLALFLGAGACLSPLGLAQAAMSDDETVLNEVRVLGTAEEELKQAPGVSTITAQDLEKRPPANDLSEIIRTMPGVNLTGNSSSGAYGNNRQIDLRGMGPENTLILIDGKPVSSRDSIRMGRSGERNTRGDSNWVPAEAVERIEVLRGPAAARYGSGASGGVVNIITKRPSDKMTGNVTFFTEHPEHSDEGGSNRVGFSLAGPLVDEKLSFRLYGNLNKTDADDADLNPVGSSTDSQGNPIVVAPAAGREGVRNRDVNALLRWDLTKDHVLEFEGGVSRQGNIYAGDRLMANGSATTAALAKDGAETNVLIRRTASITHRGNYGKHGSSRLTAYYEGTSNTRLNEGMSGGVEGTIQDNLTRSKADLDNYEIDGEYNVPLKSGGIDQVLTVGAEYRQQKLNDAYSVSVNLANGGSGNPKHDATSWAFYVEDNIEVLSGLIITPGLRLDHHDQFGSNWSPSLNASYQITEAWSLKGGIARAYKAPNLYQSNPNYWYNSRGNACNLLPGYSGGSCLIKGNADLDPEISVNKEIGIAFALAGWDAGITYFDNDYKNKIVADMWNQAWNKVGTVNNFEWHNSGKAVVRGFEGYFNIPILGVEGSKLKMTNNVTYMIDNTSRETHQPLSVIPEYTINSSLDWHPTEKWSVLLTATFYGKQEPRQRNMQQGIAATGEQLNTIGTYALFGISSAYELNQHTTLRVGVNNIGDKRLFREDSGTGKGAATYNEPGRSFFAMLSASF